MKYIIAIIFCLSILSCRTAYYKPFHKGDKNEIILNIVNDFAKSENTNPKKAFEIGIYQPSEKLYCYVIREATIPSFPKIEDSIGSISKRLHNRSININKKVFFWSDSITPISKSIILELQKNKMIDSTFIKIAKGELPKDTDVYITTDDSKKAMFYYICKQNISKFKKIYRSTVYSVKRYPEVDCNN